jgi:hypothetical protein
MSNKGIICCDMLLMPKYISIEDIFNIMDKKNILFYDSFEARQVNSPKPYPYILNGNKSSKVFIDVSTEQGKAIYEKIIKELENE